VTRYIDLNRGSYGVEPICAELQIAPSSYYAARSRPPSARTVNDTMLKDVIIRVHRANFGVYGARKVWKALHRLGMDAGRDQVARLMKAVNLQGVTREKTIRTTRPDDQAARPADLVERSFTASAPNRLWLADLTYVWTDAGFAYTAFITDAFSRRIVGWRTWASLRTDLALDALEMALAFRGKELPGLVHHSDRGVQYLAIRYTERLDEAKAVNSVGSKGDSYDNALAETVNGLYKAELIRRRKRWRTLGELELATAAWVHWYNTERLHGTCGDVPPAEFEEAYYRQLEEATAA
jgi:putative transposase